ncbi:MAG: SUMF1/EgtB/PvdO family nonheme iron enzyme [Sorangiineae bacterium]|nr:SUMF1/EgtB/PvdO family nonheme iron enzyme [Polyangiaceae bacterium]MEB2323791.1 SUMF1/EgtB/PvdO family nonheme iron enzyme [Sorangiineae bacterium]
MSRKSALVIAALAFGCAEPSRGGAPSASSAPRPAGSASAVRSVEAPLASSAPPPGSAEASAPAGPRLLALGVELTESYSMPRFTWRRWAKLSWQGDAASLPPLPTEPALDSGGCPAGMVRARGALALDASGRASTDGVASYQNEACSFWRTRDHGEHGLCDRFEPERWRAKVETLPKQLVDFCIDRYEYPNAYGEFPLVVVTFSEAEAFCAKEEKRLCTEDEWTFACEGSEALPYPYGFERDASACNIDVIAPGPTPGMFAPRTTKATARGIDLSWRGKRSGESPRCRSPLGVMDLTGNVDEWTLSSRKYGRRMILKGGHWGPARQRCRPATRGHGPHYVRYDQGFRCCADAPS